MKKQHHYYSALLLVFSSTLIIILSTSFIGHSPSLEKFSQAMVSSSEQGVVVEVVKDRSWPLIACNQRILAQSSTEVFLDDTRVMITNIWKLPEGHCLIPEKGVAKYNNLIVTTNGMAKGQDIVHPRDL